MKQDILIQVLACLVEPIKMNLFGKMSKGKVVMGLYILYCTFLTFFYSTTLRASLIKEIREKPVDTSKVSKKIN